MRLLLDTHAVLWWFADNERLGAQSRGMIADRSNGVLVSIVSMWEIALKVRIGKMGADLARLSIEIERSGFVPLGINARHLEALMTLPAHHRDLFDHLLIAQAIAEGARFVTADGHASLYPVDVLAASA